MLMTEYRKLILRAVLLSAAFQDLIGNEQWDLSEEEEEELWRMIEEIR